MSLLAGLSQQGDSIAAHNAAAAAHGADIYTCATFDDTETRLKVSISGDGSNFRPIFANGLLGVTVRDPSICECNGEFLLVFTENSNAATRFGFSRSDDMIAWETPTYITVPGVVGTGHVWAPEWFIDTDGPHVLLGADFTGDWTFQTVEMHPASEDFSAWSDPVNLTVVGGGNLTYVIDPFIVKESGVYHLFCSGYYYSRTFIKRYTSTSLLGPYTLVDEGDKYGFGAECEGPCVVRVGDFWRLYFDKHATGIPNFSHYYSDSDSLAGPWSDPVKMDYGQGPIRHGTILKIRNNAVALRMAAVALTNFRGNFMFHPSQPGGDILRLVDAATGVAYDFAAARYYDAPELVSATVQTNGVTWTIVFTESVTASDYTGWSVTMGSDEITLTYSSGGGTNTLTFLGSPAARAGVPPTVGIAYVRPTGGLSGAVSGKPFANSPANWVKNLSEVQ